jgi:pyruvate, water dikinase
LNNENNGSSTLVAVRSSATAEDLPEASFAGQQETFLNVIGNEELLISVRKCWASLFTSRAVYYRKKQGFETEKVGLCAVVQKMVQSEVSGIMFTADPVGDESKLIIEAGFGLGETIVSGSVTPDNYIVDKELMQIIIKKINRQEFMLVKENGKNVEIKLGENKSRLQKLEDTKTIELAKIGKRIEDHYKKPMDIEWGLENNILYIVQARPITTLGKAVKESDKEIDFSDKKVLLDGLPASPGIISGIAKIVPSIDDIVRVNAGDILVTKMTSPSWVPVMKKAAGIITNEGGVTCFDGNTNLLTNNGFMSLKEIHENGFDGIKVLSFNKKTLRVEWQPIKASMKRNAKTINVSVSQTGLINHNILTLTPDHKMVNIKNGVLIDSEIQDMILNKELACVAQKIPQINNSSIDNQKAAYLLGGIMTDGSIQVNNRHGTVQFIQKPTEEKEEFINYMDVCMQIVYGKKFRSFEKKPSNGYIRGQKVIGSANSYCIYSKQVAIDLTEKEKQITQVLIESDEEIAYNFLAGVIDGDGSFHNNRIQIYVSEEHLLKPIIVACLRIGIVPQVTKNRNINNVQIVEKLNEILKYTKRVKGQIKKRVIKTRFFSAKQILCDNVPYRIKERALNNLLVSEDELKLINNNIIKNLIQSDIRMLRLKKISDEQFNEVYNVTVENTHTYIVFTKNFTPLIVNNCHAAIVSRELGIPCVVGTEKALETIEDGSEVTIDGYNGKVYSGIVNIKHEKKELTVFDKKEIDILEKSLSNDLIVKGFSPELKEKISNMKKDFGNKDFESMSPEEQEKEIAELKNIFKEISVKVKVNVALPDAAEQAEKTNADGVGLLRAEHMITSSGMHPAEFIRQGKEIELKNIVKDNIKNVAERFSGPVWFRTFDARSDEYKELIGGEKELNEDNPMLGWHGIRRDVDKPEMFKAQLLAIKELRQSGIKNVGVMLPFVQSLEEVILAKKIAKEIGLQDEVPFGVMIETPASVWIIDELIPHIDFVSFGTNDLTQLTLGMDRNNEKVQKNFSELHPAILRQLEFVIKKCKKAGVTTSICGQAASNPEMVKKLVWFGIDSVSANIDAVKEIRKVVMIEEKKRLMELIIENKQKGFFSKLFGK